MKLNMLLNSPLGAVGAPFGIKMKCNPFLGAVGLIGSVMDWDAQTSANAINRQNAMETNQTNKEINESQLAWARDQYEQEKAENRFLVDQAYQRELENRKHNEEYNTPAAIAARLRDAGINPALAMQGGAGSIGASHYSSINAQVGQNPHANQPNMIPMETGAPAQAYTGLGVGIRDSMRLFLESQQQKDSHAKVVSDIAAQRSDSYLKLAKTMSEIKHNNQNDKYISKLIDGIKRDEMFQRDTYEDMVRQQKFTTALTMWNALKAEADTKLSQQAYNLNIDRNSREWQQLYGFLSSVASQNALNSVLGQEAYSRYVNNSWTGARMEFENSKLEEIYNDHKQYWDNILNDQRYDRNYAGWRAFIRSTFSPVMSGIGDATPLMKLMFK